MKADKMIYQNLFRIRLNFSYDPVLVAKIKTLPDARWSNSHKTWHIPYTKEAFDSLKAMFPDIEYTQTPTPTPTPTKVTLKLHTVQPAASVRHDIPEFSKPKLNKNRIKITETVKQLVISLPKNETDIQFLRSFKYCRWDSTNYVWIIPNWRNNVNLLKSYFKDREVEYEVKENVPIQPLDFLPEFTPEQMLVVNYSSRQLKVFLAFRKELVGSFRKLPMCSWNRTERCWTLPYAEKFLKQLEEIAQANGLQFIYQQRQSGTLQPRKSRFDIENFRTCPAEFTDKLQELRYSKHTLKSYTDLFEEFINYFPEEEPEKISEQQIIQFLRYLVNERHVSTSYQNQSINAIKFYYERVLGGKRKIYSIDRPREEETLPEVLSEEEVADIIRAISNLKHKAIIITIYSGGLRISEAINLKMRDIDSKRMQIRVEQGKGKKDRYTLLGTTTLKILREYVKVYKPIDWLFEGENGSQYSPTSIRAFYRKAVKQVGIKKQVTVHTLRHSFATHLLESGTDLRYIQSLLGHQSSRTTEIYTHITTKGFDQIKNPLDKFGLEL